MSTPNTICTAQYAYVQSSRRVLLDYLATLHHEDWLRRHTAFGRGSVRDLLIHIVNTYRYWICHFGLRQDVVYAEATTGITLAQITDWFAEIDAQMATFLALPLDQEISFTIAEKSGTAPVLQLFTHVITHEYHHKGQILSLSRQLGYTPVDTDVLR